MACKLRGINRVRKKLKDGSERIFYYHRATGIRLEGEPGSREFVQSYERAEGSLRDRHSTGTFNALIRSYTGSVEFNRKLAASTQREYRRMLTKAEPKFGDMQIEFLDDVRIKRVFLKWRDEVAETAGEREADHRLSAISAMLTWAQNSGMIHFNHVKGFTRLYHSDRSDIIWKNEHMSAFMEFASLEMQRALIIAVHTGLRQADILSLKWSAYDGEKIHLVPSKNTRQGRRGRVISIPCSETLRSELDKIERTSNFILTTKTGLPFKKRHFSDLWKEATEDAGLDKVVLPGRDEPISLHFHDIRGTSVTLLSEAGCTVQQIASITGHSLKTVHAILEHYVAPTARLAEQAIAKFEKSPHTAFANRLQTSKPGQHAQP